MAQDRRPTEERRQQIAEAALRIISGRGVHRLTALELAKAVGIADGTIFRHFKDKGEIVRAAIEHLDGLLFQDFPPPQKDPIDRLEDFFVRRLKMVQKLPEVFLAAFSDRLEEAAGEEASGLVRSMVERSQRFVQECLAEAQAEGLIDPKLSVHVLTRVVIGTLQASAFAQRHTRAKGKPLDPEQTWQTLEALLRASARRKAP